MKTFGFCFSYWYYGPTSAWRNGRQVRTKNISDSQTEKTARQMAVFFCIESTLRPVFRTIP